MAIKDSLHRIGASDKGVIRALGALMRMPIRASQLQLLSLQKDKHVISLVEKIIAEKRCLMWPTEMVQVYFSASAASKLKGDFAEVGVSKGGSAKLICEAKAR